MFVIISVSNIECLMWTHSKLTNMGYKLWTSLNCVTKECQFYFKILTSCMIYCDCSLTITIICTKNFLILQNCALRFKFKYDSKQSFRLHLCVILDIWSSEYDQRVSCQHWNVCKPISVFGDVTYYSCIKRCYGRVDTQYAVIIGNIRQ